MGEVYDLTALILTGCPDLRELRINHMPFSGKCRGDAVSQLFHFSGNP
ncbi:Uncharacterized protein dnm_065990 [Desulfonema magnum]|uniref:Uncharacterized protein n=1 Tax=Desulfonema magnum TaxID=45655 RepID=A0A975GR34_9BACT|nr:Uncharacterized protein dnm_065990 [Desulfonema magnum]